MPNRENYFNAPRWVWRTTDGLTFTSELEEPKLIRCDICGEEHTETECKRVDGKIVCINCMSEHTYICDGCRNRHLNENKTHIDNYNLCDDCFRYHYKECADCGSLHMRSRMYISYDEEWICNDCIDNYIRCDRCGEYYPESMILYDDDTNNDYCESCMEYLRSHVIHSYDHKPDPIFYGTDSDLFMGVELEIDKGGESHENARSILNILNNSNKFAYAKHDGSLSNGFEIVSHPATLKYHCISNWQDAMNEAIEMGYKSHNTRTCGLHVHVSRDALGYDEEDREDTIAKIIYFIEKNWDDVLLFTRRDEDLMEEWASRYGLYDGDVDGTYDNAKYESSCSRYKCVNLENEHTIEFRMFRGTLKYNTFIATLQFVNEICMQAMRHTIDEIEAYTWSDFVNSITDKPELIEYLKEKNLYY